MNKAKKYYIDNDGNMIGYTRYYNRERMEMPAEMFHARLKIKRIGWLNIGCYFELEDENGKTYSMNDLMLKRYLEHNDIFLEGDWNFYQQGTAFSIGL